MLLSLQFFIKVTPSLRQRIPANDPVKLVNVISVRKILGIPAHNPVRLTLLVEFH